jgi:hypothetical protein
VGSCTRYGLSIRDCVAKCTWVISRMFLGIYCEKIHLTTHAITCYPHSSMHPQSGIPYYCFHSHIVYLCSVHWLLVTANVVPCSPILVTLMTEALHSSETSVLTRSVQHNISEDGILQCPIVFPTIILGFMSKLICTSSLTICIYIL